MQTPSPIQHLRSADGAGVRSLGRLGLGAVLVFLCCASALSNLTGASRPQPLYVVGKISFDQRNVFDNSDSSLFRVVGSVANTVHILTDEEIIRRELLFREGDLYDQGLVDESGRNLRRLGIVGDVTIASDTLPDNTINITVKTRDRWTLRPGLSLRQDGNRGGFAASMRDDNFLGNAQQLKLGYVYLTGPGSPHGGEIAFMEPRLWGSRWNMAAQYALTQEYRTGALSVGCPFYSDRVPWAARFSADISRIRFLEFRNGEAVERGLYSQENEALWVASSSPTTPALQVAGAYLRTRTRGVGFQPRTFENVDFVIGAVSLLSRKYSTMSSSDFPGRIEDVPLGYQAGIAFGRNLHFIRSGTVDYFGKAYAQQSMTLGDCMLMTYQAMVTTYFDRLVPHETIVSGIALHHLRLSQNHNLTARAAVLIGSRMSPSSQYLLGSALGLRGYRAYEFYGQKVLLVNLEHRVLSLIRLWFVKLGGALFFDTGAICSQDEKLGRQRFHSSAGFTFRIDAGTGILRMDVAYNLDQRRISLGFSANQLFKVFAPMEFLSPVPEQPLR